MNFSRSYTHFQPRNIYNDVSFSKSIDSYRKNNKRIKMCHTKNTKSVTVYDNQPSYSWFYSEWSTKLASKGASPWLVYRHAFASVNPRLIHCIYTPEIIVNMTFFRRSLIAFACINKLESLVSVFSIQLAGGPASDLVPSVAASINCIPYCVMWCLVLTSCVIHQVYVLSDF